MRLGGLGGALSIELGVLLDWNRDCLNSSYCGEGVLLEDLDLLACVLLDLLGVLLSAGGLELADIGVMV